MGLGWGLIIPNLMRWYWNRFTGYGFLAGTFTGFLSATASQFLLPILEISINPYVQFFTICGLVLVACIVVSLMTQAPNEEVLDHFYQKTRPLGLWKNQLTKLNPKSQMATQAENRRDLLATFIAIPWQFTLFMSMMVFVTQQWHIFIPIFALFSGLTIALYFVWFRHLKSE